MESEGQEQARGRFSDFCDLLEEAEAGFRAYRLQRLVDAAEKSKVRTRKTVRSMGDGDDAKIFQEVIEDTVLPDPKWDAWLLERKYPEQYSRKGQGPVQLKQITGSGECVGPSSRAV